MSDTNGTGIIYPTLELGGKTYIVKFSRGGILYRLSKSGTSLMDLTGGSKNFAAVIDVLHAALFSQFDGSQEDLAELVLAENKTAEVSAAIGEALKKVFPPTSAPAEAVGTQPVQ